MKTACSLAVLGAMLGMTMTAASPGQQPAPAPAAAFATESLWPAGRMPGKGPKDGAAEHALPSRGDNVTRLTDVTDPSISVFKPPAATQTTPAVIICPGGAYQLLGIDKEGTEIAAWLTTIGITGVVLKYRVPSNMEGAFQDIQRAIRLVRHNARTWTISPDRVGVMGFSAGGHLSARLSTNYDQATYPNIDAADTQTLRPDFAVLVYPAYLAQGPDLAKAMRVTAKTPPTFLVHTEDDKSFVRGTKLYHDALDASRVPNEFFLLETGGHGYGLRSQQEIHAWPEKCRDWLVRQKFVEPR